MSIPDGVEMLTPWRVVEDLPHTKNHPEQLAAELLSELSPGHVLYGLNVRAVALRIDRDDVLFEVEGSEMPLAVVHLTWGKETDARWPRSHFFKSWEHWLRDEMIPAHDEYEPP